MGRCNFADLMGELRASRYHRCMPRRPASPPPWKRPSPPGKSRPLSTQQVDAARMRAAQAGRRYPNLVDNMWAARHVPRGHAGTAAIEDE
jgi:hypothetical protein